MGIYSREVDMSNKRYYIPFGDGAVDLAFRGWQVEEVQRLYMLGYCVNHIAKFLRRDIDAVTILVMDLCRAEKIEARPRGFWGDCPNGCEGKM